MQWHSGEQYGAFMALLYDYNVKYFIEKDAIIINYVANTKQSFYVMTDDLKIWMIISVVVKCGKDLIIGHVSRILCRLS